MEVNSLIQDYIKHKWQYPHLRFDSVSKPMQLFRSIEVFFCTPERSVHWADRIEGVKIGWVHVLEILAPLLSASAAMTRQWIRTWYMGMQRTPKYWIRFNMRQVWGKSSGRILRVRLGERSWIVTMFILTTQYAQYLQSGNQSFMWCGACMRALHIFRIAHMRAQDILYLISNKSAWKCAAVQELWHLIREPCDVEPEPAKSAEGQLARRGDHPWRTSHSALPQRG
jgi:hypothetical protein